MAPINGIELNGLFFPRRRPFPLDLDFFFLTPIPIGFSHVPKKVVGSKDNLHHVWVEEDVAGA